MADENPLVFRGFSHEKLPIFCTSGSFPKTPQPTSGQIRTCQAAWKMTVDRGFTEKYMEHSNFIRKVLKSPHSIVMVYKNSNIY